MKILIIKLRALGDVLLATPVISNLRRAFPGARIDFLTEYPQVVEKHPSLDSVWFLDRKSSFRTFASLKLAIRIKKEHYNLVLDLFGNPRSAWFTWISGAPVRVGYDFRLRKYAYTHVVENRGDRVHEVDFNLEALRYLGIPITERKLVFPISGTARQFARNFFRKLGLEHSLIVALNASGGWPTKRWPLQKFARLGDLLNKELSASILILWGPGENEVARQIARFMNTPAFLAPPTNLEQLAAIIKHCHLLISNDSGPMHLATAVGTPVVAIFGPTNPICQGPYGVPHEIVRKEDLSCLGCNGVTCKFGTNTCMTELSEEKVFQAVTKLLLSLKPAKPESSRFSRFIAWE